MPVPLTLIAPLALVFEKYTFVVPSDISSESPLKLIAPVPVLYAIGLVALSLLLTCESEIPAYVITPVLLL